MEPPDPLDLELKVGFEIHQQLATKHKLFCNCKCEEAEDYYYSFMRKLRPTRSELGTFDPAALFEFSKARTIEYSASKDSSCLVEADEEPPGDVDPEALETALIFALALKSKIMDEIHVMRKIVIDGSNTSGFQRTMLVATGGGFQVGERTVGVQSICLEEDASKLLSDDRAGRKYGLDRLGVPLVEIALEPVTGKPAELKEIALTLGRLLRASRRVARGLGSIRQDVNISIKGGNVIEVKGVQQLDQLSKVIEFETLRQHCLLLIASELRDRKVSPERIGDVTGDVTDIFSKSQSKVVAKIRSSSADSAFVAVRIPGFVGLIGYEPYPGIRLGKELGKLVSYFGLDGIFHSDELPN
ncbi:MAG TPA: Glu-tRNA(Gln) amidotransferase subunit GatE, partial [Nitrososphaera sp.]|nr:Glu-tRNA(Gln) amidotransferase subunit GatE [Nitrososphaera sp.]